MLKIAICDDEKKVCSEIENIIVNYQSKCTMEIDTEIFLSGEELCRFIANGYYFDLIFLDIEMKMLNGIEVGRKLRNDLDNQTTQIVYVSCCENYYRELFEFHPLNFINKPVSEYKIVKEINKTLSLLGKINGVFSYKIGQDILKVPYKNILWFESVNRKISIVMIDGQEMFYENLNTIEEKLSQHHFMRIHRTYLINYFHVTRFKYTEVTMSNNITLPISKSNQKPIRNLQAKWDGEMI